MRRLLWILLLGFTCTLLAETLPITVYQLHYNTAETMIPIVKPLLSAESSISGTGQKLIVKGPQQELDNIRQLLKRLDVPPRNLIITVRRFHDSAHDTRKALQGKVIVYSTQTKNRRPKSQQITVENGHSALIGTGREIPQKDYGYAGYGLDDFFLRPVGFYSHAGYKDIKSGLLVTPTLINDRVQVKLQWQMQQLQDDRSQQLREISPIEKESASTVVTVNLGEWINIGTLSTRNPHEPNKTTYDTANIRNPNSDLYLRVDLANKNREFHAEVPDPKG